MGQVFTCSERDHWHPVGGGAISGGSHPEDSPSGRFGHCPETVMNIPDNCHLIVALVFIIVVFTAGKWVIQTVERTWAPCDEKKQQQKHRKAAWITSLEGASRKQKISRDAERRTSHSVSNSSVESIISICSCSSISEGDVPSCWMGSIPSPTPGSSEGENLAWQLRHGRPPQEGLQQPRRKSQRQLQWGRRRAMPWSHSPAGELCPPALHSAVPVGGQRPSRISFLGYKQQELLNWHIYKKHQDKKSTPTREVHSTEVHEEVGVFAMPEVQIVQWVSEQRPSGQRSRGHTLPPYTPQGREMPPRPPSARSPRPSMAPPKELPFPSTLICKSESHTSFRAVVESPKEELCSILGPQKSPPPRSKSPKGKEKGRKPSGSPKEGHKTTSRPGSPKNKQGEGGAVLDLALHRLSWADTVPESPKPSISMKPPSPACLPFLGPLEAHEVCSTKVQEELGVFAAPEVQIVPWVGEQRSSDQRSRSRSPPPFSPQGRETPPRPPSARSQRPSLTPPKDLPPLSTLFCKSESHTSLRAVVESKMVTDGAKEDHEEILSLFGPSKSPPPRSKSPKEKEKGRRRSGSPKGEHRIISRPGSPKNKLGQSKADRVDAMPESITARASLKPPSSPRASFLDPSFMSETRLEKSCVVAAEMEKHQESCLFVSAPPNLQGLAQAIVESLDKEQAVEDLHLWLAKGLKKGKCVEYPVCLLCACCNPSCAHPRRRHSPSLLVCPQLSVRDREVRMNLGFFLKIKKAEAIKWEQVRGMEAPQARAGKGRPPKHEQERSRSRHQKGHAAVPPSRASEKAPRQARQRSTERPDRRSRRAAGSSRAHSRSPRPAAGAKPAAGNVPKTHPGVLKRLLLCMKKAWARVRGKTRKDPRDSFARPTVSESQKREGVLLKRQASHPRARSRAERPSSSGRRRASLRFEEPEATRASKKRDGHRARSASSGASKKHSRKSSPEPSRRRSSRGARARRDLM